MSPTDTTKPGIKGKRVPGKPGRFDPSGPLHMTTRRATKTQVANGSPSLNGSGDDSESHRDSLDGHRPMTSHSNDSRMSVKSEVLSTTSPTVESLGIAMNGTQSSPEDPKIAEITTKPLSPNLQSPSLLSLKRKRSSPTTPTQTIEDADPIQSVSSAIAGDDTTMEDFDDSLDAVELIPLDQYSDREPSHESSQSDEGVAEHGSFVEDSMDATPVESGVASPATSESDSQDDLGIAKPLHDALEEVANAAPHDPIDAGEDVDDDGDIDMEADADAEEDGGDEVDEQPDYEGQPRRRFGGRRRAAHPNPKVERAIQRQADLKAAYRSIARAQKAVLAEIAQRTIEDLDNNPYLHLEATEYEGVKDGLDDALDEIQTRVESQHLLTTTQLKHTLESQAQTSRNTCKGLIEDFKDAHLILIQREMLRICRAANIDTSHIEHETDDEDDVLQKPKGVGYRWKLNGALDEEYHSRTRLGQEMFPAMARMDSQVAMRKLLEGVNEEDKPEELRRVTTMDATAREAALVRHESIRNAKTLAEAAAHFERVSKATIRNEDALGLQMLGDLASRPSITSGPRGSLSSKRSIDSIINQSPHKHRPSKLQLQTNYGPTPIPLEMSPRTTQAMGDRFDNAMPPPMTPRQGTTPFVRSPELTRTDSNLPSPTMHRPNGLQNPTRHMDSRPESRSSMFMEYTMDAPTFSQRSERRQEAPLISPGMNNRMLDPPSWRDYPRERQAASNRRASTHSDRPSFEIPGGLQLQDERRFGRQQQELRQAEDFVKHESPYNQQQSRPAIWMDSASRVGASDARQEKRSITGQPRPTGSDELSPPHSRKPSLSFVHDFGSSVNNGESHRRHKQMEKEREKEARANSKKYSHDDRSGQPRRQWRNKEKSKSSSSFGTPASAGSTTIVSTGQASSPVERSQPPPPWAPPPQHSPIGPLAPPPSYSRSPYGAPSQAQQHSQDQHNHHRSSFPPPPTTSSWDRLPPTPLYSMPSQHQPPPPGVPPEQYNRPFAPPPPPGYQPPPHVAHASPPVSAQSPPGSYSHQYGGPALAPATSNAGFHPLRPSQPLPAFAQQAQQQQNSQGHRRRAQSDAANNFTKFQPWNPPPNQRRQ